MSSNSSDPGGCGGFIIGAFFMFLVSIFMSLILSEVFVSDGQRMMRTEGCASACERRSTEMSHERNNFCVCTNGHIMTLDLGGMYREVSP